MPGVDDERPALNKYLGLGSNAVTGAAGAAAALGLGPAAGVVAAGAAPFVSAALSTAVEFVHRTLGGREELRSSSVLAYAIVEVERLRNEGRTFRDDEFFDRGNIGRSAGDEIFEAVLLAAQRDPEEAKLPLLGRMMARIAFDERVDRPLANHLVRLVEHLSYRQLCLVGTLDRDRAKGSILRPIVRDGARSTVIMALSPLLPLMSEMLELHQLGLLRQLDLEGHLREATSIWDLNPGRQGVNGQGLWFRVLMDLSDSIPDDVRQTLVHQLDQWGNAPV